MAAATAGMAAAVVAKQNDKVSCEGLKKFDLGLSGKSVIVTGASKGIGAAVARKFAAEGSKLHLVSRTRKDLEKLQRELESDYNASVVIHPVDLGKPGAVAAFWASLEDEAIDVVVNNAGAIPGGDILAIDEARWRAAYDLKLFGYINMSREACDR